MFAKLFAAGGLTAALLVAAAPAAQADTAPDGCVTQLVAHVNGYYYTYRVVDGWVTVNGVNISVNGSTILADTFWNAFVTEDYSRYMAGGVLNLVTCIV